MLTIFRLAWKETEFRLALNQLDVNERNMILVNLVYFSASTHKLDGDCNYLIGLALNGILFVSKSV